MPDLSVVGDEGTASSVVEFDYAAEPAPLAEAAMTELEALVCKAEEATRKRLALEKDLSRAVALERQLLDREIPELMDRLHQRSCETTSGVEVRVQRELRASLPGRDREGERAAALQWLDDNGHGGVVKLHVVVALPQGEKARADLLAAELRDRDLDVEARQDVHAATLSALVRELVADGKSVPPKIFNLFDQRSAKLKRKVQ